MDDLLAPGSVKDCVHPIFQGSIAIGISQRGTLFGISWKGLPFSTARLTPLHSFCILFASEFNLGSFGSHLLAIGGE
jgi:hypothetical protein